MIAPSLIPKRPGVQRKHDTYDASELARHYRAGELMPVRIPSEAEERVRDKGSDLLRCGQLRAVYHGGSDRAVLKDLARAYANLVAAGTRVTQRLKALVRARGIRTPGTEVYRRAGRAEWLRQLPDAGVRFRATVVYRELEVLQELRPKATAAMLAEARRDPAWRILRTIPSLGPVRVAVLLATLHTPWRFRTKRRLWAYAGLAVVTHTTDAARAHQSAR